MPPLRLARPTAPPPPPRAPRPPTPSRGPRPARLTLAPLRAEQSARLDAEQHPRNDDVTSPPFLSWREFLAWFAPRFEQGDHLTFVGTTKSGKTTFARQVMLLRQYIVVMATKARDENLYPKLERIGFVTAPTFESNPAQAPRQIFKPPLREPGPAGVKEQKEAFESALRVLFMAGAWCVLFDEIRYLTDNLRLATWIETLYLQGRTLDLTLIGGTQRPYSVPQEVFSMARFHAFFNEGDRRNLDRMAEFNGVRGDLVRWLVPRLPPHEALVIDRFTPGPDGLVRTKAPAG